MEKKIETIRLYKKKGVYFIGGKIAESLLLEMWNCSILGYGIEGYIIASYVAALCKKNVGFIREKKKEHGTCKRIDGDYDRNNLAVMFVDTKKLSRVQKYVNKEKVKCKCIFIFDVINSKAKELEPLEFHADPDYYHSNINEHIIKLTDGEFVLSSGTKSTIYYETLKAANTYTLLNDMIRENESMILSNDIMIGVGYGGIYFGLLASLIYGKPFVAIDVSSDLDIWSYNGKVLLFDDCTSTGSTIYKLCDALQMNISDISVLSLYVKRRAFFMIPKMRECSILG